MIRTFWVFFVGVFSTIYNSGNVVLRTYFWRRNLHCACDRAARNWGRDILWAAGLSVKLEGLENLSLDEPQIVVSNHQSWFDVWVLATALPVRYRFVAKKELGEIPIYGKAWKSCGHVSVDRGNREAAIESLNQAWREIHEQKLTMVLFPEGTRSPDGLLKPFKKGAFVLAVQGQVPLVPVAVIGTRDVMPKGSWRVRKAPITLRIGSPIPTEGATIRDRNRLLKDSWNAIAVLKGDEGISEEDLESDPNDSPNAQEG